MWRDPYFYLIEFTGANVVPASADLQLPAAIDREADFEWHRIHGIATSTNLRVRFTDQDDRILMSDDVASWGNLIGDGQRPYRFPMARVIKRTNQIRARLFDRSGAPNTVRLLLGGAQLFPAPPFVIPRFAWAEPYPFSINFGLESTDRFGQVPVSGSIEGSFRVPGDSWIEIHGLTLSTSQDVTLQLLTNSTREWFRNPVHSQLLGAVAGGDFGVVTNTSAQWPFEFNPPKLIIFGSIVTARLANLTAIAANTRLTFQAIRRYLA